VSTFKEWSGKTVRDLYGMGRRTGDFGIEVELEGTGPLGTPVRGWQVHEEGSLRAPGGVGRGGAEYVTGGAIKMADVIPAVQTLQDSLRAEGIVIDDDAHRTSTHIHLNAQNVPIIDMLGILTVFTAIEPLFLYLCGQKRDGNSFCAPAFETGDLVAWLNDFCKAVERWAGGVNRIEVYQRGKYASLSTFRLHDLGTLEFRCFPHSVDPQEIHKWCTWLQNLRSLVVRNEDKSFRNLIKTGIHNPRGLSMEVFGYLNIPEGLHNDLVSFGSQEAYELTRVLKRYLKKTEEDYKKKRKPKTALDELNEPPVEFDGPFFDAVPQAGGWGAPAAGLIDQAAMNRAFQTVAAARRRGE
jgi:hypothetical protein